jgi:hypothetical protein
MANLYIKQSINYMECDVTSRHVTVLLMVCTEGYPTPCWPSPVVTAFILMSLQRRYLKTTRSEGVSWRQYVQYIHLRSRQTAPSSGVLCTLPEARTRNTIRFNTIQRCLNQHLSPGVFTLDADTHDAAEHLISHGDLNARSHWQPRTTVDRNCTGHTHYV